ncbi:hypothetical protein SAMN05216404_103142 [Nitrosospira multiformis]|uniref:Uncharacterized protein n=1 Tax=Nitrosospira multiformis TaxID=1231 RepID=A0A1H8ETK2_9PROT|nr:hypothetical protein SAMN05216404_103142 [Nitrosospira multiformis]
MELRPADRWPALNLSILATDIDADVLRRAKREVVVKKNTIEHRLSMPMYRSKV